MGGVVVPVENQVEARNLLSGLQSLVFFIILVLYSAFSAAMKETDNNVRVLFLLDLLNPFLGTCDDTLEPQTAP